MHALYLLAIDDLELFDVGIAPALVTDRSERLGFGVRRREGTAASVFFGGSAEPAEWHVVIRPPTGDARDAVLAALGGDPSEERRLLVERDDALRSRMLARAAVVRVETPTTLDLLVAFEAADSVWEDEAEAVTGKLFSSPLDRAVTVAVPGNARTAPSLLLRPAAQRSARTAAVGWTWRRRYAVTNGSDEPMFRYPVRIALGATTGLVAGGKALASGDDVRVWLHGLEQERALVGWNSSASYLWVVAPALPAGEALVFDVAYGNPAAGPPPALAYPNAPAFALGSSTNQLWVYEVDAENDAGSGLWYVSSPTGAATVDFGVPGAWRPARTFDAPDGRDKAGQYRTAADNLATFWAERGPPNSNGVTINNGLDGVAIHNPFGIASLRSDFQFLNEGPAGDGSQVARLVAATRDSAAEPWDPFFDDGTLHATTAAVALATRAPASPAKHLAVALWSTGVESAPELPDDQLPTHAAARFATACELAVDPGGRLGVALLTAEEEVYELATELRLGGGAGSVAPYRALLVGNARGEAGAGTPRCALRLDQTLAIDAAARTHVVWATAAPGVPVEAPSAHAVRAVTAWTDGFATVESPISEWLTLAPPRTPVPNGDFGADAGSWRAGLGAFADPAGMAVARGWDPAVGGAVAGSLRVQVTANSAGAGATAWTFNHKRFAVNGRANADAAAWVRTGAATLTPRLAVAFYDAADNELLTALEPDWAPAAGAAYRRVAGGPAPDGAAYFRVGLAVTADAAGAVGSVWLDDVTVNDNDLVVTDVALGALEVAAVVRGRWL